MKALDEMSVKDIWDCYNLGEAIYGKNGCQTGVKPPLRLVEQHFQSRWRKTSSVRFISSCFTKLNIVTGSQELAAFS
jgi:hypothetical protein